MPLRPPVEDAAYRSPARASVRPGGRPARWSHRPMPQPAGARCRRPACHRLL